MHAGIPSSSVVVVVVVFVVFVVGVVMVVGVLSLLVVVGVVGSPSKGSFRTCCDHRMHSYASPDPK